MNLFGLTIARQRSAPAGLGLAPSQDEIDKLLDTLATDINRQNLVTLGREFTPEIITQNRHRARYGDPRFLFAMYDEMVRLGPAPQMTKAIEAMKASSLTVVTTPEEFNDDSTIPKGADLAEAEAARQARDLVKEILTPWYVDLIAIHARQEFYGMADSRIRLDPRGTRGRFDAIAEVAEVPQRRHRLDVLTQNWLLMLSPDSYEGVPVDDLKLRPDGGIEGLFLTEIGRGSVPLDQRGLLFRCLVYWGVEQFGMRWWAKNVELFGVPPRVAYVDFAKPTQVANAKKGLATMGATSFSLMQEGTRVDLLQASSMGANNPHEALIAHCRRGYDAVILGHEQATGVQKGVGGKIQGRDAMDQFEEITNSRLTTFSSQINRLLVPILIARNLGASVAAKHSPQVRLAFQRRDDPAILSTVAFNLKSAGAGKLIDATDLVQRCTFKLADPGGASLADEVPAEEGVGGPDDYADSMGHRVGPTGIGSGPVNPKPARPQGPRRMPAEEAEAGEGQQLAAVRKIRAPVLPVPRKFGKDATRALRAVIDAARIDDDDSTTIAAAKLSKIATMPSADEAKQSGSILAAAMLHATMQARENARRQRESKA